MRAPHVVPALLALLILAAAVMAGGRQAEGVEDLYVHALAPEAFLLKTQGTAMQAAAIRQPDLLPLYGSSELNAINPYHASRVFASYPTGFAIFTVGKAGQTSLSILQDMAAIGPDLRGKKVALSLSPPWFFVPMVGLSPYAGNFSRQHASALAFSPDLSFEVKQAAARRMLQYPSTLEGDPLLAFALDRLAKGTLVSKVLYYAALPLGKLRNLVLRLQDHWETVGFIQEQSESDPPLAPDVPRERAPLDWAAVLTRAQQAQRRNANNNPFGFGNRLWETELRDQMPGLKNTRTDEQFLRSVGQAAEWIDLDTLLRALKELGADVLVLSMPINGTYYDYLGVSREARQVYYDRLRQLVAAYGYHLRDFAEHDPNKYFLNDPGAHASREGWVYYDQALDAFYHGTLR